MLPNSTERIFGPGKTECLLISVLVPANFINCFNVTFQLKLNTSYVVNQNLSIYSEPVENDIIYLNLANSNCCSISFSSAFLSNTSIQYKVNNSKEANSSIIRIPIELDSDLCSKVELININFNVEHDSTSEKFLYFAENEEITSVTKLVNSKSKVFKQFSFLISTKDRNGSQFIEFNIVNADQFKFFFFNLKLSLVESMLGEYKVNNKTSITSIDFMMKSTDQEIVCSLVGLSVEFTKFSYLSLKSRVLNITFNSSIFKTDPATTCLLRATFSISKFATPNFNVKEYVLDDPENFFHIFASNSDK